MKLYLHWDMEGVSGIFTREQVWFWEEGTRKNIREEGRQLLIADINSAVAAALDAGADSVIVCDTHTGGGNILLDRMLPDPRVVYHAKSRDAQGRLMPGLDETVDGLLLMGHHAKAETQGEFLPHTWMLDWADFQINGTSVGETGIEACFAGHWNVPPIMVQGTEAVCREAEELFPGLVTASVKRGESHDRCAGLDPDSARLLTGHKVREAVEKARARRFAPYKPKLPITVTVRMKTTDAADKAAMKPAVHRVDEHTVEGTVDRQCDVVKWILGQ